MCPIDLKKKSLADSSHCAFSPKACPQLKPEVEEKAFLTQLPRTHTPLSAKTLSSIQDSHLCSHRLSCSWPRNVYPSTIVPRMERSLENRTHPPCPQPQTTEKLLFTLIISVPISLLSCYGKGQILTPQTKSVQERPLQNNLGRGI